MNEHWNMAALSALEVPEDLPVTTDEQLRELLSKITFDHSVIDFKWSFEFRAATFPPTLDQNTNKVTAESSNGWMIWATFLRPDIRPPHEMGIGRGRDEIIIAGMKTSGVVKTAWVLVEMLIKHELMEAFRFNGVQIFNPHNSVYELMIPAVRRRAKRSTAISETIIPE